MGLTPVEIRHITVGRALFGYSRSAVDTLLEEIVDSFEHVWRERADFADKIEHLDQELVRHRELETLLRKTLVSAERAAQELKEQARREAELVVTEAHAEARRITRDAAGERERLTAEVRRIRSLLEAALAAVGEGANGDDQRGIQGPEAKAA